MNAFVNDIKLSTIEIDDSNEVYKYENGILLKKDGTEIFFISDTVLKSIETLEIPSGIKSFTINLGKYSNITKIIIPSSVITMISGEKYPSSITEIEVKEGNESYWVDEENKALYKVDKDGNYILIYCYSKDKEITLNSHVQIIYMYAFCGATNMEEITLPNAVTTIRCTGFF